ncbi:MAG: hypothetical protein HY904_19945 [Deltaproteobacteria bacterium]|nr:hypothetical protein [Deltaproteobacteria bacterium]
MEPLIVVEGDSDAALLARLTRHLRLKSKVVVGHGASSAVSMARSHLALGAPRVILVLDADSENEEAIKERCRSIETALAFAASEHRWRLVMLVPDLERSLLSVDEVAGFLLGNTVDKRALEKLKESGADAKNVLALERAVNQRRLRVKLPASAAEAFLTRNPKLLEALRFAESVATAA